jgi:Fe-S-cluster containining protein
MLEPEMSAAGRGPSLPLVRGAEHLTFRCNGCGACCRELRVTLTHRDLERLSRGLGRAAATLVDWLAPDAVDMTDEPGSFVELGAGRRLMVLRHAGGACHLLDALARCSAYEHRPRDCRLFPFDLERDEQGHASGLARLALPGCGDETGPAHELAAIDEDDRLRWRELAEYQARVARWNTLARHRRRFRLPLQDERAFLAFLGLDAAAG